VETSGEDAIRKPGGDIEKKNKISTERELIKTFNGGMRRKILFFVSRRNEKKKC